MGDLARRAGEWAALADAAGEPNVFYEPEHLVAAARHLGDAGRLRVLFVRGDDGALDAVVPLKVTLGTPSLPFPHHALYKHAYCYLATPLLRPGREVAAVRALFAWLDGAGPAGRLLRAPLHEVDGPFDRALAAVAGERGHAVYATGTLSRALLRTGPAAGGSSAGVSARRRKDLRRRRRRLEEHGPVGVYVARTPAEVHEWLPRFVALEHGGWKGRQGTSFQARPADAAFLHEAVTAAAARGRVELFALTVGGAPVAMVLTLECAAGAYSFKIAYDERYARHSPGVLLDVELLDRTLAAPTVPWVDSGADPDDTAVGALWPERRVLRAVNVSAPGWLAAVAGRSTVPIEGLRERVRERVGALDPDGWWRLRSLLGRTA